MKKLKKVMGIIWSWLKSNWLVILVITGVVFLAWNFISVDKSYKDLFKNYSQQSADNQKQISELRQIQEQERVEREQIMQTYLDELHRIEREYKAELGRISAQRDTNQDNIINNYNSAPSTLTDEVTSTFGIPVEQNE